MHPAVDQAAQRFLRPGSERCWGCRAEIGWIGVNSRTLSSKRAPLLGKGVQRMSLNRSTFAGGATAAAARAGREDDGGG